MITSGEVGAVFRIVDEASPTLKKLMDQFKTLQGVIDKTKLAMKDIVLPPSVEASINGATRSMAAMGDSSKIVADNFVKMDAAINESVAAAVRGSEAMAAMARSSAVMSGAGNAGGAALPSGATLRGRTAGAHSARAGLGARIPAPHPFHAGSTHNGFAVGGIAAGFAEWKR